MEELRVRLILRIASGRASVRDDGPRRDSTIMHEKDYLAWPMVLDLSDTNRVRRHMVREGNASHVGASSFKDTARSYSHAQTRRFRRHCSCKIFIAFFCSYTPYK